MNTLVELADSSLHILLVDDSLDELRQLGGMLRAERFRLTVACDGRKGYQCAVVSQPDLILMDVTMPHMDGFVACRLLKTDPTTRHIPVIFLTAKNAPQERLLGLQLGGIDYVSKPVLAEEVIVRIRIHLNRTSANTTHRLDDVSGFRSPDEVVFNAAVKLIQDRLEDLPPLPEIARMVGTHEKRLGQIFRDRIGTTVSGYVAEERIRQARRLVAETDMAIQKIAEQVGFGNAGNFTTAFRKRMGMTPSLYRQVLLNKAAESS